MTWPEIWTGDSFAAKSIRTILLPASWLYRLGWAIYLQVYKLGIKKAKRPHSPVICVGNLVVGGSGKTPIVIYLARLLRDMGYEVVISASGYGSPASEAAKFAPSGPLKPSEWGDEPALLRDELPDIPLIVGRRRVLAAELCAREFPNAVMLMDDGIQHMPLARDLSFIVDPGGSNRNCLPAGPYREPFHNSGDSPASRLTGFRGGRAVTIPGDFTAEYSELVFEGGKPDRANILCAIGNPDFFIKSVEAAGVKIQHKKILPDHDPLTSPDLWQAAGGEGWFASLNSTPVVITQKDWVKIRQHPLPIGVNIIVARREAKLEPIDKLKALLKEVCG